MYPQLYNISSLLQSPNSSVTVFVVGISKTQLFLFRKPKLIRFFSSLLFSWVFLATKQRGNWITVLIYHARKTIWERERERERELTNIETNQRRGIRALRHFSSLWRKREIKEYYWYCALLCFTTSPFNEFGTLVHHHALVPPFSFVFFYNILNSLLFFSYFDNFHKLYCFHIIYYLCCLF